MGTPTRSELFFGPGSPLAVPTDPALNCRQNCVVVPTDALVHPPFEQPRHDRIHRGIGFAEMDAGRAVAEIFEPSFAVGFRPQRFADGVVHPRLEWLDLREPLPRFANAT